MFTHRGTVIGHSIRNNAWNTCSPSILSGGSASQKMSHTPCCFWRATSHRSSPASRFPWMVADPSGELPHFFACD